MYEICIIIPHYSCDKSQRVHYLKKDWASCPCDKTLISRSRGSGHSFSFRIFLHFYTQIYIWHTYIAANSNSGGTHLFLAEPKEWGSPKHLLKATFRTNQVLLLWFRPQVQKEKKLKKLKQSQLLKKCKSQESCYCEPTHTPRNRPDGQQHYVQAISSINSVK